ncbi:hypothetical protein DPMN_083758 [Dreissena polymorpha]|uniref:Uncharacterized protein n=1 Tax=Dreissena polymorpha TaxID=45954 RepID=A0A9D4BK63_DREPO|nr:hypothetical protein DPMN_083758 [Dreissena polymorpha]
MMRSFTCVRTRSRRQLAFESDEDDHRTTTTTSSHASTGTRKRLPADETQEISEVFADDIIPSAKTVETVSIVAVRAKRTAKMALLSGQQIREKNRNLVKDRKLRMSRELADQ